MKNPFQYWSDKNDTTHMHDWYFTFAGCECGPIHGRDNARIALRSFKKDYIKLLKKYNGGNHFAKIYAD